MLIRPPPYRLAIGALQPSLAAKASVAGTYSGYELTPAIALNAGGLLFWPLKKDPRSGVSLHAMSSSDRYKYRLKKAGGGQNGTSRNGKRVL